jgi:putative CocE/NonD family hydrolase
MSDTESQTGWNVAPRDYVRGRKRPYEGERLISKYVEVRDGTKLAVDIHLPGDIDEDKSYPTICVFTPYYRRFALAEGARNSIDASPTIAFYRNSFVKWGYALVCVDVRGSGASFGCRDGFRSPKERLDHYDIADWVSKQDWCDGNVGATGVSYPGAASDFLASTNHPAVKAVAPLFAVWDTWSNHLYPGGVLLTCVSRNYGQLADALDYDERDLIPDYAYFKDDDLAGPAPVDEDPDGEMVKGALYDHSANFNMQDFAQQLRFRDAPLTDNPDYTSAKISPYNYANRETDKNVAYYSVSGWMDGGGYSVGTIQRHMWLKNPENRLMLGPWDHGARGHCSPWRPDNARAQQPFVAAEVLRFFDKHLKGIDSGIDEEAKVHYYTMGAEEWRSSPAWPPKATDTAMFFAQDGKLENDASAPSGEDEYQADYACRTGIHTRYDRLYIANVDTYYDDWHGRDEKMLNFTSSPFGANTEVTGHPVIDLHFKCSERDCAFFVYLSDITPDGKSVYVTEGVFRALHRKEGKLPTNIPETGPSHSFSMADAAHLEPGEEAFVSFELLPTSYLFKAGHSLRISIAACDSDHFTRIPDGRPPLMTFLRGGEKASKITLPVI